MILDDFLDLDVYCIFEVKYIFFGLLASYFFLDNNDNNYDNNFLFPLARSSIWW